MLKKLPKNKADLKYINPNTGEVECTYNQCYMKFEETSFVTTWHPKWAQRTKEAFGVGDGTVTFEYFCHECKECGRRQRNTEDASKSVSSYRSAAFGAGFNTDDIDETPNFDKIEKAKQ
jgi:hypothetical protein